MRRGRAALLTCLWAASMALCASSARADTVLYRVNCGGPAIAALDGGPAWAQDLKGAASPYVNAAATGDQTFGTSSSMGSPHPSVPAYVPLAVFNDERWDPATAPEMRWEFPVAAGTYRVNLMLAEGYSGAQAVGARVFTVMIEGATALANFDVFATYGGYKPAMQSVMVPVSDGALTIDWVHVNENPAVRGIEVASVAVSGFLAPSPSSLAFGDVQTGTLSAPQTVTLTNLGGTADPAITVTGVAIAAGFSHTLTVPQTLSPGASVQFDVRCSPASVGPLSGALTLTHDGTNSPATVALTASGVSGVPISFGKSVLGGTGSTNPTSLQFGPDQRLYVAQQNGLIKAYTVARAAANTYSVTATETITLVQSIPNHNDDGALNPAVTTRQVTGLVVTGTAANPVLYVSSSDPRIQVAGDSGNDTNSGILSRLTWDGSQWNRLDLVRGLPRSKENHSSNGLFLDAANQKLYVAQGGHTNMGAPSTNFTFLPEYALSAAILAIDLAAIGETTYDLPTLDDEDRPGVNDANDPFGGNRGKNQARLVPGGPVQVYSPGWRNPYDVVILASGRMVAIDNGPNSGWGGPPVGEGPAGTCTNGNNDNNSASFQDNLHLISAAGFYAGHPNPTRASTVNTFNATNPQSPVAAGNAVECDYRQPGVALASGGDGALATWPASTNGLCEYRAANFGGAMTGNLLACSFDNSVQRVVFNAAGDAVVSVGPLFSTVGNTPLDVTSPGGGEFLPGTIWVCDHGASQIVVYEPADFAGGGGPCSGIDSWTLDEDGDGFKNADEIDNATSPCSAGDVPPDFDGDHLSDKNDADDDNDGTADVADAFARDAANGNATPLPVAYSWNAGDPGFGILGLGFTGLMTNGVTDYLTQYDPANMTPGGAAGKVTIDAVSAGDAAGGMNTQQYAFQFGVVTDATTGPFTVHTRVVPPYFDGLAPQNFQSMGLFIGSGDQDNYLKAVVAANGGAGGIEVLLETAGAFTGNLYAPGILSAPFIDLVLAIDPATATVQPRYSTGGGTLIDLGPPLVLPAGALRSSLTGPPAMAVGILSTSNGAAPFAATWDFLNVIPDALVGVEAGSPPSARRLAASPNPFRSRTALGFSLARPAQVKLAIYDVRGTRVRTLVDGFRPAGTHRVEWDGRDARGDRVAPGLYFVRCDGGDLRAAVRVVMID